MLTATEYAGNSKWFCICSCPNKNIVKVSTAHLNNGHTTSCGCYHKSQSSKSATSHGMSKTVEYRTWRAIQNRCYNDKLIDFKNYGGRGICVCDRWLESFENFYEDMGPRPGPRYSIDRFPDVNGNYCKENCRWATAKEQGNNKRNNRILLYNGKNYTLSELARESNLDIRTLHERLSNGWSIEEAVKPLTIRRSENDIIECNGESLSFKEWSIKINISIKTIYNRLDSGWSIESTLNNPILKGRKKRV